MKITISILRGFAVTLVAFAVSKGNASSPNDGENFELDKDEYYKMIASFWTMDIQTNNLTIVCLGALIKSDWVFVTKECHELLPPPNEILVCVGSDYINNVTSDSTIKKTLKISGNSRFVIVVLNVTTQIVPSSEVHYMDDCKEGMNDKVLVGWNILDGPTIKKATVTGGKHFFVDNFERDYSYEDFYPGSLVMKGTNIIGLTKKSPPERLLFCKVTLSDYIKVKGRFQISSKPEDKNNVTLSRDEHFKVIVSFWEVNRQTEHRRILCLGALIRSNWILTNKECDCRLHPIEQIGVLTGSKYFIDPDPEFILDSRLDMQKTSHYVIIVLNTNIELSSLIELGFANEHDFESESATWIGWNETKGPTYEDISVLFGKRMTLPRLKPNHNQLDFPLGSLIVRGDKIIGITYFKNETKFMFYKVLISDYLKIEELRRKADNLIEKQKRTVQDGPSTKRRCFEEEL